MCVFFFFDILVLVFFFFFGSSITEDRHRGMGERVGSAVRGVLGRRERKGGKRKRMNPDYAGGVRASVWSSFRHTSSYIRCVRAVRRDCLRECLGVA